MKLIHQAGRWRMSKEKEDSSGGLALEESRPELKRPPLFKVVLINDDYTPMDFVVEILIEVFKKDELTATQIMLNVHNLGKGICGVYPFEIAETKVARVHELAQLHEYPLQASMEAE